MEIIGIKVDKNTLKKIEDKIKRLTTEMENCLTDFGDPTCYELFRTDSELIWIRFDHEDNKIEIIREEQS
jgi:hypothetical protein